MTDSYEEEKKDPRISGWKEPGPQLQDVNNKDLKIHYARYGLDIHNRDVIELINMDISSHDRLNLLVNNNNLGGDYYYGQKKQLHIIYTFNGVLCEERLNEGELLVIPKLHTQINGVTEELELITQQPDTVSRSMLLGILLDNIGTGLVVLAVAFGISQIVKGWRYG